MTRFPCNNCGKTFVRKWYLNRHQCMCLKKESEKITCDLCGRYQTYRKDNMKRHRLVCLKRLSDACLANSPFSDSSRVSVDNVNNGVSAIRNRSGSNRRRRLSNNKNFPCSICQRPHHSIASRRAHESMHASRIPADIPTSLSNDFARLILADHAFGGHLCDYDLLPKEHCSDVLGLFQMSTSLIKDLSRALSPSYLLKGRMVARVRALDYNNEGQAVEVFLFFPSHPASYFANDWETWYNFHSARIIELVDSFARNSSNLVFDCIERVYIKLNLTKNSNGQGLFVPPRHLANTKSFVNVDTASECFNSITLR